MALSDTSRKTVEGMIDQFLSPACYYDVLVISYETFRAQHQRFARKKILRTSSCATRLTV